MTMLAPGNSGVSAAATGTVTNATASLLTFAIPKSLVAISNNSAAAPLFVILNDAAAPTVSPTVYDFIVPTGTTLIIDKVKVQTLGCYVAAASPLVRAVGW